MPPPPSASPPRSANDRISDPTAFAQVALNLHGPAAVRHLVEVSAGLDSQMLGENEIFGQVKDAYAAAQSQGTTGPVLNRVFQKGFQAAKQVRSSTAITQGQVSVANVAVELALTIYGSLETPASSCSAPARSARRPPRLFKVAAPPPSRWPAGASNGQWNWPPRSAPAPCPSSNVRRASLSLTSWWCATSAPDVVVTLKATRAAMQKRPAQPLFFIDQALPRDVEPGVAELENVFLYNLDDLARIAEQNRAAREAELVNCRAIVEEKSAALWRQVADQVAQLRSAHPDTAVARRRAGGHGLKAQS
jgi:glutamyl-tRNA reductase